MYQDTAISKAKDLFKKDTHQVYFNGDLIGSICPVDANYNTSKDDHWSMPLNQPYRIITGEAAAIAYLVEQSRRHVPEIFQENKNQLQLF